MYMYLYILFMALCVLFVWVAFLSFLLLRKLVCYTHVFSWYVIHVVPSMYMCS